MQCCQKRTGPYTKRISNNMNEKLLKKILFLYLKFNFSLTATFIFIAKTNKIYKND